MEPGVEEKIQADPRFRALVRRRARFCWGLAGLMLAVYYGFILIVAFAPSLLGTPLGATAVTTVGIPVGIAIILLAFALTAVYIRRANRDFDRANREILRDASR